MKLAQIFHRESIINHKIEFLSIFTWLLFFPFKESHLYFFGFAIIICVVLLKNIYFMKTIGLSYFSHFLMVFNFLLILSVFFSVYAFKSILLYTDIFLISCYFVLFFYDSRRETDYFQAVAVIISVFSFINIILFIIPILEQTHIFFVNPIHEGIISGIGALLLFFYLLKKWNPWFFGLLIVNLGGVFVSQSKAAFLGIIIFGLLLILMKKKKLIPYLIGFIVLTMFIPNPIRSAFYFSIKKDPYALNRIDIWKMSLTIFKKNLLTGVGLDNFAEVTDRYNFKQTRGPANYAKIPRIPHNDYLKVMTELGMIGLVMILALFYFLAKKIFSASLFKPAVIVLLYLLFQAFLFNILFSLFFFFIFLFLMKNILENVQHVTFRSFTSKYKIFFSALLIFVWIVGYLLPFLSNMLIEKSRKSSHLVHAYRLLKTAEYLNPLDQKIYYSRAGHLYHYFKQTYNLESFYEAMNNLGKARRLNRYFINAYLLEVDLYRELLKKKIKYESMDEEILAPLRKAEIYAPFNPFIKLTKARVYFEFGKMDEAKEEAVNAINLEPEFVAALYFLQKNFNYFPDEKEFQEKITEILKKARELNPAPGHYLYRLYEIPQVLKPGN